MNAEELKSEILSKTPEEFVDNFILSTTCERFPDENVRRVASALSRAFSTAVVKADICVVGSAKIGFGLFPKRQQNGELPAFRPFRPDSDIDIAIVCPAIFDMVWKDLSRHAIAKYYMPWDSGQLGDYMLYGWIRPDLFPNPFPIATLRQLVGYFSSTVCR